MNMDDLRATDEELRASLDEGLLSLCLPILVYTQNPYRFNTFQWRMKARPRISTQAELADEQEGYGVLVAVVVAVAAFGVGVFCVLKRRYKLVPMTQPFMAADAIATSSSSGGGSGGGGGGGVISAVTQNTPAAPTAGRSGREPPLRAVCR
jgi:hypothetical protein